IGYALLIFSQNPVEDLESLLATGLRPGGEGLARRADCFVHISRRAQRDAAGDRLRGRIDGLDALVLDRIDPTAVDIELQILAHISSIWLELPASIPAERTLLAQHATKRRDFWWRPSEAH